MYSPHVISILVECRPDTMNPHSLYVQGQQYTEPVFQSRDFERPGFRIPGLPFPTDNIRQSQDLGNGKMVGTQDISGLQYQMFIASFIIDAYTAYTGRSIKLYLISCRVYYFSCPCSITEEIACTCSVFSIVKDRLVDALPIYSMLKTRLMSDGGAIVTI